MKPPQKILAMQFKFLGDAIFVTPALRAIKKHFPHAALHFLAPQEFVPLYQHNPWIDRVWGIPRVRGRASFKKSWPVIRALRKEKFDRSIDFVGNDRGALMSLLCGARERLGPCTEHFKPRHFCYTQRVSEKELDPLWTLCFTQMLAAWGIPPMEPAMELHSDPALTADAEKILPAPKIICHLTTGQAKKNWRLAQWAAFCKLAAANGVQLAFLTGRDEEEKLQLTQLKRLASEIEVLPGLPDLAILLAVIKRANAFIAGDTGLLHCAGALGVPVIGLFGTHDSVQRAAPVYEAAQKIVAPLCTCPHDDATCSSRQPCMAAIAPEQVFAALKNLLPARC